jgi:hypothetical protein
MDTLLRLKCLACLSLTLMPALCGAGHAMGELKFMTPAAISQEDIDWFRQSRVSWIDAENGAPAIVSPGETLESQGARFERVFLAFAVYADLKEGVHGVPPDCLIAPLPAGFALRASFDLTKLHMDLMRIAWWRSGYIDPKYPYGSYNYYQADIAERLGGMVPRNADGIFELTKEQDLIYETAHRELIFALCAFVRHASLTPGAYQLPLDGWEGFSSVRLSPPSKEQLNAYLAGAGRLLIAKALGGEAVTDFVIPWIKLNDALSETR